jgi:hypothetical protein
VTEVISELERVRNQRNMYLEIGERAMRERDAAQAVIAEVRKLHRRIDRVHNDEPESVCAVCREEWPCDTIALLPPIEGDDDE